MDRITLFTIAGMSLTHFKSRILSGQKKMMLLGEPALTESVHLQMSGENEPFATAKVSRDVKMVTIKFKDEKCRVFYHLTELHGKNLHGFMDKLGYNPTQFWFHYRAVLESSQRKELNQYVYYFKKVTKI